MPPYDRSVVALARDRFTAGRNDVSGVRGEIVESWVRCRDGYGVDPDLRLAPTASDEPALSLECDVVVAELSGIARSERADLAPAIVTVVDGAGRLIAEWGDVGVQRRIAEANLARWAAWSESASGTNGMGTALAGHGITIVHGPEHWCQGFQDLECAGIAVHDPVTGEPLGAMNVTTCGAPLPNKVTDLLRSAAGTVERTLHDRARYCAEHLVAEFERLEEGISGALAAIDIGGGVVAVNERGAQLLGIPAVPPTIDPAERKRLDVPELDQLMTLAIQRGKDAAEWRGAAGLSLPSAAELIDTTIVPVFSSDHPVGLLLVVGSSAGEPLDVHRPAIPQPARRRIVAQRGNRCALLEPAEIRYAEADGNTVWLQTDRGRLRAATRGLHNVAAQLGEGFLQVHRRYVVNIDRIREFERGFSGELLLVTDVRDNLIVPVSRTRAKTLRTALGI